jgi:hypothetical protein
MVYNYSVDEVKKKVRISLGILCKNDSFLLENGVNERSIAHKLAEYLQIQFPDWNVDCEYNKKGLDRKILDGINECSEQKKTDRVYPDIIVHKRNTDDNLLVIEIKIKDEDCCDIEKLKKFTSISGEFKYKLGLFIKFNEKESLRWFENGTETKN